MLTQYMEELKEKDLLFYKDIHTLAMKWFTSKNGELLPAEKASWALLGIRELMYVGDRLAYRSELALGVGITEKKEVILWQGAQIPYVLHSLVYGLVSRYDKKIWGIFNVSPEYKTYISSNMQAYTNFVNRLLPQLKEMFADLDTVNASIRKSKERALQLKPKDNITVYTDFAPVITESNADRTKSISTLIESYYTRLNRIGTTKDKWASVFSEDMSGELYYCYKECEKLLSEEKHYSRVTEKSPKTYQLYGEDAIFSEVLKYPPELSLVISRIRRADTIANIALSKVEKAVKRDEYL